MGKKGELTATREDYLRAIKRLHEEKDARVGTTDVARYLNLSKSTVSERLKELMRNGLVKESFYSPLALTARGEKIATMLTYKHRLIEVFLHSALKVPLAKVHAEAHRLEHAFSDEVIEKLRDFLGNPSRDPHGMKIPAIK